MITEIFTGAVPGLTGAFSARRGHHGHDDCLPACDGLCHRSFWRRARALPGGAAALLVLGPLVIGGLLAPAGLPFPKGNES